MTSSDVPGLDAIEALRANCDRAAWRDYYLALNASPHAQARHVGDYLQALHDADLPTALREITAAASATDELRVQLEDAERRLASVLRLAMLWSKSEGVDDLSTRVTNRAYAGPLLELLQG